MERHSSRVNGYRPDCDRSFCKCRFRHWINGLSYFVAIVRIEVASERAGSARPCMRLTGYTARMMTASATRRSGLSGWCISCCPWMGWGNFPCRRHPVIPAAGSAFSAIRTRPLHGIRHDLKGNFLECREPMLTVTGGVSPGSRPERFPGRMRKRSSGQAAAGIHHRAAA